MRIKLTELKPNPFHDGKLEQNQIDKLANSMKGVGFQGALDIQKNPKTKKYHIVFGHHRIAAAKEVFGKNCKVEVVVKKWNEDDLMRGKSNENLTQTHDPEKMISEIVGIRSYLKTCSDSEQVLHKGARGPSEESGSINSIVQWLNAKGEIIPRTTVQELLKIHDNLAPELRKKIEKGATNEVDDDGKINYTNAVMLSSLENKTEQKEVLKAFQKSKNPRVHRIRTRKKILTQYKEAPEEEKKAVREGKKDIALIGIGGSGDGEITPLTIEERFIKVQDALWEAQIQMDLVEPYIETASVKTAEKMGLFLKSFAEKNFAPFTKKILLKCANVKMKGGIYWENGKI